MLRTRLNGKQAIFTDAACDLPRWSSSHRALEGLYFCTPFCTSNIHAQDPVVHVSVASVAGDMTEFAGSFIDQLRSTKGSTGARPGTHEEEKSEGDGSGDSSESENEEEQVPSEVCVDVDMVVCKAGTTVFHAPLLPGE